MTPKRPSSTFQNPSRATWLGERGKSVADQRRPRSRTHTDRPACASRQATMLPPKPEPTTATSNLCVITLPVTMSAPLSRPRQPRTRNTSETSSAVKPVKSRREAASTRRLTTIRSHCSVAKSALGRRLFLTVGSTPSVKCVEVPTARLRRMTAGTAPDCHLRHARIALNSLYRRRPASQLPRLGL